MYSKTIFALTLLLLPPLANAQRFLPDDPLNADDDRVVDVGVPAARGLSDYYDFVHHTFALPGDHKRIPALNANTLGEVPDSSWFQNRHGVQRMTIEQLVRGPNRSDGPVRDQSWTVTAAKTEGITPGFRIRDSRGDAYFIKFDPPGNAEMATAAEVIVTKLFYAIGYNVPENYLVFFSREELAVGLEARITTGLSPARRMTDEDLDAILARVDRLPDGRYRAVASKVIDGRPIGPFKYYGTRSDDPNDVIPHEHRRELRGLHVFSAWLNHDDSRAVNTLDAVQPFENTNYIRHYLIDFGSTLGSGSVFAQKPRAGFEYLWEPRPVLRRIFTLGLWDSSWIRIDYPDLPSIGRFESREFDPSEWKPEYPNPAFMNALPEDLYWASKIVMSFTDEDIRAVVKTGALSDPFAEQYLIDTLIERRNKIGREYFEGVLPVDHFAVSDGVLRFKNLSSICGFLDTPESYSLAWFTFDNETEQKSFVDRKSQTSFSEVAIPAELRRADSHYFGLDIEAGSKRVSVFIHRPTFRIVGIDRGE